MPSLFNRRSRSVSTTRPAPAASSSAHLAAAQAFMAKQPSTGNLSSAAAAAALRSMSPTPTPVNQVQTKRMRERQSSISSIGSGTRGRPRMGLQRQPSAGSMTERTFRSPSPGQNAADPVPRGNAPPVPRVPQQFVTDDLPPIPKKSHRRSMSLDTSSPRVMSPPPPARSTGHAQTANRAPPPAVLSAAATAARRSASLQQNNELERSDSRNSINFSYPRGSRPNSPPPPTRSSGAANSTSEQGPGIAGISPNEAAIIKNSLNKTAEKPVKKKKKKTVQNQGEGSYLHTGSVASTPAGSSLATGADGAQRPNEDQPVRKPKKKVALTGQSSHFPDSDATEDASSPISATHSPVTTEKRPSRASGALQKQPSVVREDWEGEQDDVASSPAAPVSAPRSVPGPSSTVQSKKPAAAANVSRKIEDSSKTGLLHNSVTTPVSKPVESVKTLSPETQSTRQASISPSRSFRFSDRLASDLTAGRKHEPLPRSVSPAKSALKHHSPARAAASPGGTGAAAARRGSSVTPSESSEVSADGWSQRKKAVRVSFEADPEVVGVSAEVNPALRAAEKEGTKRGLFGFGKTKGLALGTAPPDMETDEGMKPRPALPSFGSVRKNRQAENSPSPTTKRQDNSNMSSPRSPTLSDASSTAEPSTMQTSVSSDHAVGGVLFREAQKQNNPLPPEVTTVEGSGYHSDTDSLSSDESDAEFAAAAGAALHYSETGNGSHEEATDRSVPAIAVQPATPGPEEGLRGQEWLDDVPGGSPGTSKDASASRDRESDSTSGIESDENDHDVHQASANQTLNTILEEESSDNDSIYSDAAEDLSDLEGDGFGSINAIVESPMVASPTSRPHDVPDSPSVASAARRAESKETASWDNAQAHWSTLAQQSRDNLGQKHETATSEHETAESEVRTAPRSGLSADTSKATKQELSKGAAAPLEPPARISSKPKEKEKKQKKQQQQQQPAARAASTAATGVVSTPPAQVKRAQPASPGTGGSNPSAGAVVATKRLSAATKQGGFRQSMRSEPEPAPTLRQRPQSMVAVPTQPRGALQKKHIPPQSPPKPVQRTFSNDSDSDSSFRKERRNRRPAKTGGFGMRTSMRSGPTGASQPAPRDTRRDVRSLSPVDRRPTSPLGSTMRMTMRGSQDRAAPTLRGQPEQKRSASLFGRSRKSSAPARPASSFGSKLKSRIADSDDEDGPRQTTYKSRFADSSDEEDFEPLRPVRGIPKRKDEGDSTDLDDSSDDQRRKAKTTPKKKKLEIQVPTISSPVPSEPMSPTTAKKKGFWGRLRGKKDKSSAPEPSADVQTNGIKADAVDGPNDKQDAGDLGYRSTAERDALVEETMRKLEAAQGEPASPARGKLQRRITPQRVLSDSWPLPPKMPAAGEQRPITSDGLSAMARPGMGDRVPTSDTLRTAGGTEVYGRGGKKKRFPRLRKAFGLTD